MTVPAKAVLRASQWCYRGVWKSLTNWFHVPKEPPNLQGADDSSIQSFRPAEGYLRYQKFFFWFGLVLFDGALLVGWIVLLVFAPWVGILLAVPIWAIMILPDIVVYIAIHLRYDTMWYVLSDRSMRLRRGIWIVHETTITYENIQNVSIRQGPLQRFFGISDVLVETAGGGAMHGHGEGASVTGHYGLLEGIGNPEEVRNLIVENWRGSKSAGLGDEHKDTATVASVAGTGRSGAVAGGFSATQILLLEEISDLAGELSEPADRN